MSFRRIIASALALIMALSMISAAAEEGSSEAASAVETTTETPAQTPSEEPTPSEETPTEETPTEEPPTEGGDPDPSAEPSTEPSAEPSAEPPTPAALISEQSTTKIAHGTDLTVGSGTNASGGLLQERILTHTPGSGSAAMVAYGSSLRGLSTAKYVSNWLIQNGYDPVAGTNGDFFMTDTGIPIGIVVTDGVLRTSDRDQYALGMLADGTSFIGKPSLDITVAGSSETMIAIDYVNKTIQNYGTYLMTSDYSATSRTSVNTLYIRLTGAQDALRIGGTLTATVAEIFYSSEPVEFAAGEIYLAATVENGNDARLSALQLDETVTISVVTPDPVWTEARYAVGGGALLVKDGEVLPDLETTRHPRTAVGVREDGALILYTVDGRRSGWSVGMGLDDLAKRMRELGCVAALNLDGGGSTAMVAAWPGYDSVDAVNRPSDGQLRAGANYIFIVNTAPETGVVSNLGFYGEYMALAGTSVTFDLRAWDENFHAMPAPEDTVWSVSGTDATISEDGVLTAGKDGGTATVTATYGEVSASTTVEIIGSPDEIRLYDEQTGYQVLGSIVLNPSEVLSLRAECIVGDDVLDCTDEIVTWSFSGDAGSVDASGAFTASNIPGRVGTLTASIGSTSVKVRVTIGEVDVALEDFEGSYANIEAGGAAIHASIQSDSSYVARGEASGKINYDFSTESAAGKGDLSLRTNFELPSNANYLRAWLYGDGSQNTLAFSGTLSDGSAFVLDGIILDFVGYREVSFALPSGAERINLVTVMLANTERMTGTIYLDQLVAGRTAFALDTMPSLENIVINDIVTPGSVLITAALSDGGEPLDPSDVTATLDGERVGFYYDAAENLFVAILADPDDRELHRFTVTASDADGNLMRHSIELDGGASGSYFADAAAHWSAPYADFLHSRGVLADNYTTAEDGTMSLRPAEALTRVEFAVMMANYLAIDTSRYAEVVLPYTDMNSIPEYARGAVVAMYLEKIITGKSSSDGGLFFDPNATITRAEIMTIIGRTLPKGYAETEVVFTDADAIPEYAREHISRLVELGIVNGYEDGSIRPGANVSRAEGIKLLYEMY